MKVIDHERFEWERLEKKALHPRPQAVNECVKLTEQNNKSLETATHRKERQVQNRDQPAARKDKPIEASLLEPRSNGPIKLKAAWCD